MPALSLPTFVVPYFLCFTALSYTQTVINSQIFTDALAIVEAPGIGIILDAGNDINLLIDVSGDGMLANWQESSTPGSSCDTRYDALEIYLVSSDTSTNLTVSAGPGLLTQEQGSPVKHWNWQIPTCISAGNYNLTIYERSHINGRAFFSITPISLYIQNINPVGEVCNIGMNYLEAQPQPSSPPSTNPWTGRPIQPSTLQPSPGPMTEQTLLYPTPVGITTVTVIVGVSGAAWPSGIIPHITTPAPNIETVAVLPSIETTTIVLVSPATETLTMSPSNMTTIAASPTAGGFLPVNSSVSHWTRFRHARSLLLSTVVIVSLAWLSL